MQEYDDYIKAPTPQTLGAVLKALDPTINSEIHRFQGPKPLLRSKARTLAVKAIKSYNPAAGAQLRSWVTTQLQPLARYGQQMRPVKAPEVAIRQAAQINRVTMEMSDTLGRDPTDDEIADEVGISAKRVRNLKSMVTPSVSEGTMSAAEDEDMVQGLPAVSQPDRLKFTEEVVYEALGDRDKMIFDLKTGKHGRTMLSNQEIARRLGVTPALISQRSLAIAMQIADVTNRETL